MLYLFTSSITILPILFICLLLGLEKRERFLFVCFVVVAVVVAVFNLFFFLNAGSHLCFIFYE